MEDRLSRKLLMLFNSFDLFFPINTEAPAPGPCDQRWPLAPGPPFSFLSPVSPCQISAESLLSSYQYFYNNECVDLDWRRKEVFFCLRQAHIPLSCGHALEEQVRQGLRATAVVVKPTSRRPSCPSLLPVNLPRTLQPPPTAHLCFPRAQSQGSSLGSVW